MEDFVPFDLAKKLREKGFREECIAYYHTDGELLYNRDQYRGGNYKSLLRSYNSLPKNPIGCEQIDAPTISQVLKWLRKEKIYIVPTFCVDQNDNGYWDFRLISTMDGMLIYDEIKNRYNSYEQAALAGIEYVLNNLI